MIFHVLSCHCEVSKYLMRPLAVSCDYGAQMRFLAEFPYDAPFVEGGH